MNRLMTWPEVELAVLELGPRAGYDLLDENHPSKRLVRQAIKVRGTVRGRGMHTLARVGVYSKWREGILPERGSGK